MTPPTSPSPVILITGAARGLGAALAVNLAKRGARLALVGLESDELARTAADCDRARHPTPATPLPPPRPQHLLTRQPSPGTPTSPIAPA